MRSSARVFKIRMPTVRIGMAYLSLACLASVLHGSHASSSFSAPQSAFSSAKRPRPSCTPMGAFVSISEPCSRPLSLRARSFSLSRVFPTCSASESRVALVTGANKGIGKEIARKLAAEPSSTTILGCRNEKLGIAACEELQAACVGEVLYQRLDLTDQKSISAAKTFVDERFGHLDVLVNNAAICFNDPTLYGKVPHTPFEQQADITLKTNFVGTLAVTKEFLPLLRASSSPRIVNIASAAGRLRGSREKIDVLTSESLRMEELESLMAEFVRDAEAGEHVERGWPNTCYGVSKMGLIALTRVLARDEPSLMVNSVDPGFCATDQNMNQGVVSAERGAQTAAILATLPSEEFFTGIHWFEEREMPWSYS